MLNYEIFLYEHQKKKLEQKCSNFLFNLSENLSLLANRNNFIMTLLPDVIFDKWMCICL